jgi:hypothetical protein
MGHALEIVSYGMILSRVFVAKDKVRIGESIYWIYISRNYN